jgi:thioester reductase-like protein/acyl carrier protein
MRTKMTLIVSYYILLVLQVYTPFEVMSKLAQANRKTLGLPKPIYLTVGGLNAVHEISSLDPEAGYKQVSQSLFADKRPMLAAVPFFHAMGILVVLRSIMCQGTIVSLPADMVLNAGLVIEAIEETSPASGIFPPSILEDICTVDNGVQTIGKLESVFFGGAPLATKSGDRICQVTRLLTVIGSTEGAFLPNMVPSVPDEWNYFVWSSAAGAVMESTEGEFYELVLKRKDIRYQTIFHTFPELQEWRTKDLFQQHPSKSNLWKYKGRRDDVIVLSNGEKFTPVSTEKLLESHPWLKGALVVGQGKFQAGLLLEPEWSQSGAQDSSLIDHIWPLVEQANREAPAHARIYRSRVTVAKKEKPFQRAAKGSIIRLVTAAKYKEEIEALYADAEPKSELSQIDIDGDFAALTSQIRTAFKDTLSSFTETTTDDTDIFSLGVDSLDVLALVHTLTKSVHVAGNITAPTIYNNPTVEKLSNALMRSTSQSTKQRSAPQTREEKLNEMVRKYTADMLRQKSKTDVPRCPLKHTVILTGSTGSLGGYLLEQLIKSPDVRKVYCMNRSTDAETRQRESFKKHHDPLSDFSKVVFLKTDFGTDMFGLSEETYSDLLSNVTVFIHSAWSVDFNKSLDSYESVHVAGTRRAVDFAYAAKYDPYLVFVSSIASVGNWTAVVQDGSAVPESVSTLFDNGITLPQGYSESKYVAAQILAVASHRLGIKSAIIRASQLAGPSKDHLNGAAWNTHEWFPTLVRTSQILKKIPKSLGTLDRVDWVPMDKAAGTIIDISTTMSLPTKGSTSHGELTSVFHLANPRETSWKELYPVIQEFFKESANLNIDAVDFEDWLQELKQVPRTKENAENIPGLKLIEFYESLRPEIGVGLPSLVTQRSEALSATLRALEPIDATLVGKWLLQWAF